MFSPVKNKGCLLIGRKLNTKLLTKKPPLLVSVVVHLDIGDVSGAINSHERQEIYNNTFGLYSNEDEVKKFFNTQIKDLETLLSSAKKGHTIRLWKSNAPYSACGFAFVCYVLKDIDCEIKVVSLAEYHKISSDTIVSYTNWSEILPKEFHEFLYLERDFSKIEKTMHAHI